MSTSSKTLTAHHCLSPKTTLYALRTAVEPVWAVVTRTFRLHLDESSHHRALFLTLSAVCLLIQCLDDLHKAAKFNSIYWSDSAHSWTERAKQYMTDQTKNGTMSRFVCLCVCILYVWVFLWLWLFVWIDVILTLWQDRNLNRQHNLEYITQQHITTTKRTSCTERCIHILTHAHLTSWMLILPTPQMAIHKVLP